MTNFEFPHPESPTSPDQLGGLSDAARKSLTDMAIGDSEVELLIGTEKTNRSIPEFGNWYNAELEAALGNWSRYKTSIAIDIPSLQELKSRTPNFMTTMNRLYEAKNALLISEELTPDGCNIGETMNIVLVPWKFFSSHLQTGVSAFRDAIDSLRRNQSISNDYFDSQIISALRDDLIIYRNPNGTNLGWRVSEYLDLKTATDGTWGVMLAQTSLGSGLRSINSSSFDALTSLGRNRLKIDGIPVDKMGILEWLALTLQTDTTDKSLVANENNGNIFMPSALYNNHYLSNTTGWEVPYGIFTNDLVCTYARTVEALNDKRIGPRLAVV